MGERGFDVPIRATEGPTVEAGAFPRAPARPGRFTSLDGLRGIAALVVAVHHSLLFSPELAGQLRDPPPLIDGWQWWFTYTPLHLLWVGPEAVFLFFVLSGFVVPLPFLGDRPSRWRGYFPRRLLRLYLPVIASVVLAALLALWSSPDSDPGQSWWVNLHDFEFGLLDVVAPMALVFGANPLNTVLWSLQWEVAFSVLLPLFVWVAVRLQHLWLLAIAGSLIAICVGHLVSFGPLIYLPMFAVGVLMAVRRRTLTDWGSRLSWWHWGLLLITSLLLIVARWVPRHMPELTALSVLGCALLIFIFLGSPLGGRVGNSAVCQWLGVRSFSLYLVHEPIVVVTGTAMDTANPALVLAVALPSVLIVTEVFYRLIEGPSHRLAARVGRAVNARSAVPA